EKGFRPVLYIKHRPYKHTDTNTRHHRTRHTPKANTKVPSTATPPQRLPNNMNRLEPTETSNAIFRGEARRITTEQGLQDGASRRARLWVAATVRSRRSSFHLEHHEGVGTPRRSLHEGYGVHGRRHRRPMSKWCTPALTPLQRTLPPPTTRNQTTRVAMAAHPHLRRELRPRTSRLPPPRPPPC
uniref:Uncharacterized protein n=1 Tax=Aegilops tauschii subsp. strangulata TaxID=200361 RepID=A0A452ZCJ2_AEGTS